MPLKAEIKSHDGIGRLNKIILDRGTIESPNLVEHFKVPILHHAQSNEIDEKGLKLKNSLKLAHLPSLHHFSNFNSSEEVLSVLKEKYFSKLSSYSDVVLFPIDRASSLRSYSKYPQFIQQASEENENITFGGYHQSDDDKTDWDSLNSLPFIILGELSNLYKNHRSTFKYLQNILVKFPLTLKYAPLIPPNLFPLFSYLGIDFFDFLYGRFMAQSNIFLDWNKGEKIDNRENFDPPCQCTACLKYLDYNSISEWLTEHNDNLSLSIIIKVRNAIKEGELRDLVKQTILSDPSATALLRIFDLEDEYKFLNIFTPTLRKKTLLLTDFSDYIRPEVKMFQKRVQERFNIPEWTEAIILLPCSAKKPYSESRSHRLFSKCMHGALKGKKYSFLELIVTSPLGVVPRFFEQVYPAGFYDIPVTGNWTEFEKNIVDQLLLDIFSKLDKKIPIISYLAEPEKSILVNFSNKHPEFEIKILDLEKSETSDESLDILYNYLKSIESGIPSTNSKKGFELEFFRSMANYQFGKEAGEILFPPETEIKLRSLLLTAFLDKKQIATFQLGHITLTIDGASRLAEKFEGYRVYFAGTEINGSALYNPGIAKADHLIQPEDDVLIFSEKNGEFLGIGKSHLTGSELEMSTYGIGVSIKKKFKGKTN